MITLSLIAVVYIGLVALVQADMKKLIAYSSISHMGFVTLGFFIFNADGMLGGLMQMISHGFISAAHVPVRGRALRPRALARDRRLRRCRQHDAGVRRVLRASSPWPTRACRAPSGFVGEFFVILGTIKVSFWYAFLAATTLIFGAAYTLWMVKRVIYGEVANDQRRGAEGREPARARVPRACSRSRCSGWACIPSRSPT